MKSIKVADDDLNEFMNKVVKYTMISFQSDLSSTRISPVDEGRLRSNWFATEGSSSNETTDDTNSPQTDAKDLSLDYRRKYYLTNNLDYAETICFVGTAVSKPKNWFEAYFNGQGQNVVDDAVRKAEGEL